MLPVKTGHSPVDSWLFALMLIVRVVTTEAYNPIAESPFYGRHLTECRVCG
jgi:hypothetical protein